jgi:hypothetical protein
MITVFFSYAHADEALRDRLDRHLAMLKRQGVIDVWHDRRIVPGEPIDEAIAAELERADLMLLLVSPDFLASDYCYEREMRRALERHAAGEAQVLPVILRPSDWHQAPFGHLLATPTDGKPITKFADLDDAFLEVTKAIRAALAARGRTRSQPKGASSERTVSAGLAAPAGPRSSNLRLKRCFTEADKDRFLDESFEFMARFFENSLSELEKRNPGIETTFKRIDAHQFTAVAYRDGNAQARCRIFIGRAFSGGIAYSANDLGLGDSYNENISVEADEQSLFLRPLGMSMHLREGREARWTMEGAAEYYWLMFIEPLQR